MFTRIHRVWPCIVSLAALLTAEPQTSVGGTQPKLLIVVAHPDDEYMFAATTYRLVRELHWVADQVVITNGESGYRYASLAEAIYGTRSTVFRKSSSCASVAGDCMKTM